MKKSKIENTKKNKNKNKDKNESFPNHSPARTQLESASLNEIYPGQSHQ